jgi:hypothetical protein
MIQYVQVCIRSADSRCLDSGMLNTAPYPAEEGEQIVHDLNERFKTHHMHMEAFARPLSQIQARPSADDLFSTICQMQGMEPVLVPTVPVQPAVAA